MADDAAVLAPETPSPVADGAFSPVRRLTADIYTPAQARGVMGLADAELDNVAWHDFTECMYLLPPSCLGDVPDPDWSTTLTWWKPALQAEPVPPYLEGLTIFTPHSVNFGLRLVYRQEWRPLGNQRGDIVKTIPLGPGQVERVSSRILRRARVARQAETLRSVETTTEAAESTKDSSEVIREAASTFNWHLDAQASAQVGFGPMSASAGIQAGMGGGTENRSRATATKLSEAMQKTASRIRSETKTVVSTESESSFETTHASEIRNPNDAIAITYVYSKLQRQYEVFTSLAEVHNVVFIALPMPAVIDVGWVRDHDWILSKVLLDESFRDALNAIGAEPDLPPEVRDEYDTRIEVAPSATLYEAVKGNLSGTDISRESETYRETLKAQRERKRQDAIQAYKRERLLRHIRANVFYYMRAIWSQMDPEARMLVLRKALRDRQATISRKWHFHGYCGDLPTGVHDAQRVLQELVRNEVSDYASAGPTTEEALAAELEAIRARYAEARDGEIAATAAQLEQEGEAALARTVAELEQQRAAALERVPEKAKLAVLSGETAAAVSALKNKVTSARKALAQQLRIILAGHNAGRPQWLGVNPFSLEIPEDDLGALELSCKKLESRVAAHLGNWWFWPWHDALRAQAGSLGTVRRGIDAAKPDERLLTQQTLQITITPAIQQRIDERIRTDLAGVNANADAAVASARVDQANATAAAIGAAETAIARRCDEDRERDLALTRARYDAARRNAYPFDGEFRPDPESPQPGVDVLDIINPAGPIGYYGNYAIYYMKPDLAASDLQDVLAVLKTPYLSYTSVDQEPVLMDPYLKGLTRQYAGVVPDRGIREEMVEYVPDLRLRFALFQDDVADAARSGDTTAPSLDTFFADDSLFAAYYPEYLFRRELTRRFPVDTNNLVLDIEVGAGTALEAFKKAHRGIDVEQAFEAKERMSLENARLRQLLAQGSVDARFWPDDRKLITLGDGGARVGFGLAASGVAAGTDVVPVIQPVHPGDPVPPDDPSDHGVVFGLVEEGKTHAPLAGAEVQLLPDSPETVEAPDPGAAVVVRGVTSAHGMFSFRVRPGTYRVVASAEGHEPSSVRVDLNDGPREIVLRVDDASVARGYVANRRTRELHRPDCPWVSLITRSRRVSVRTLKEGLQRGFDRCAHCLPVLAHAHG